MSGAILTINGGSSTIKFAIFAGGERSISGKVDRIGEREPELTGRDGRNGEEFRIPLDAGDHAHCAHALIDRLVDWNGEPAAVGHRVVHGGPRIEEHQRVTPELIGTLREAQELDVAHLPREIALIEAFRERYPELTQVACFDTVFHRNLPRIAQLLPIPRRHLDAGVRRLGFHGLSYMYLTRELRRIAGDAADGKVILAHLGSGASMAAMRGGAPVDTSMGFTPAAGLVMGSRPGDLDPGLVTYLMRVENRDAREMDQCLNREYGLAGVSGGIADMRDLVERRGHDTNAAEAFDLFCYQARKQIGAYAAALGGLDTLVFSGGIGERSPEVRAGICAGLEFLGVHLDAARNNEAAPLISASDSRVAVRVIATDEEWMVAKIVSEFLT